MTWFDHGFDSLSGQNSSHHSKQPTHFVCVCNALLAVLESQLLLLSQQQLPHSMRVALLELLLSIHGNVGTGTGTGVPQTYCNIDTRYCLGLQIDPRIMNESNKNLSQLAESEILNIDQYCSMLASCYCNSWIIWTTTMASWGVPHKTISTMQYSRIPRVVLSLQ